MTPALPYRNRSEAGRLLAVALDHYKCKSDVLVLGLARGGLAVASEVAGALQVPLDVLVVRKLGAPSQPELAIGAIARGTRVLDERIIHELGISPYEIDVIMRREQAELERRERAYRAGQPPVDLKGRTVILVDDGLATGSTMFAAVRFAREQSPKEIVLAVPVASIEAIERLRAEVDRCVCLATPKWFYAVGAWYLDFPQVTDAQVKAILEASCPQHVS
jgi:putative phosphoribosyl transferase